MIKYKIENKNRVQRIEILPPQSRVYCAVLNRRTDLLRQVEVHKEAGTMI